MNCVRRRSLASRTRCASSTARRSSTVRIPTSRIKCCASSSDRWSGRADRKTHPARTRTTAPSSSASAALFSPPSRCCRPRRRSAVVSPPMSRKLATVWSARSGGSDVSERASTAACTADAAVARGATSSDGSSDVTTTRSIVGKDAKCWVGPRRWRGERAVGGWASRDSWDSPGLGLGQLRRLSPSQSWLGQVLAKGSSHVAQSGSSTLVNVTQPSSSWSAEHKLYQVRGGVKKRRWRGPNNTQNT